MIEIKNNVLTIDLRGKSYGLVQQVQLNIIRNIQECVKDRDLFIMLEVLKSLVESDGDKLSLRLEDEETDRMDSVFRMIAKFIGIPYKNEQ